MTLEEIAYEFELAGLSMDDKQMLLSAIKRSGFDPKATDEKLKYMGYAPIFTIYDDEEDESQND